MTLSTENRALVEREVDAKKSPHQGKVDFEYPHGESFTWDEVNRLVDAAREEGRQAVVDQHLVENGEAFYVVKDNVTEKIVGGNVVGTSTFTPATAEELLARNKRASDRLGEAIAESRRRWPEAES